MKDVQISIIIATRNREAILWQTVEKAIAAIEGKNAEIIIVNDGDQTLVPGEAIANKIQFLNNPFRGVSFARNFGAANAKGNILFFIDDDMWINSEAIDWIAHFMQEEKNNKAVYNLNWQYPDELNTALNKTKIGRFLFIAAYHRMWGRMKQNGTEPQQGFYECNSIASCSLLMHKNLFNTIGGYRQEFIFQGEDIELSNRLRSLNIPIYAVFDVLLYHNHQDRMEIHGFLKRVEQGYQSEFKARAAGFLPKIDEEFTGSKKTAFEIIRITEPLWIFTYKVLPNLSLLNKLNARMVGLLSGLQKFKQWKNNR